MSGPRSFLDDLADAADDIFGMLDTSKPIRSPFSSFDSDEDDEKDDDSKDEN